MWSSGRQASLSSYLTLRMLSCPFVPVHTILCSTPYNVIEGPNQKLTMEEITTIAGSVFFAMAIYTMLARSGAISTAFAITYTWFRNMYSSTTPSLLPISTASLWHQSVTTTMRKTIVAHCCQIQMVVNSKIAIKCMQVHSDDDYMNIHPSYLFRSLRVHTFSNCWQYVCICCSITSCHNPFHNRDCAVSQTSQ